jgi:hypothetical protein
MVLWSHVSGATRNDPEGKDGATRPSDVPQAHDSACGLLRQRRVLTGIARYTTQISAFRTGHFHRSTA